MLTPDWAMMDLFLRGEGSIQLVVKTRQKNEDYSGKIFFNRYYLLSRTGGRD
jgi:hypothetical protein